MSQTERALREGADELEADDLDVTDDLDEADAAAADVDADDEADVDAAVDAAVDVDAHADVAEAGSDPNAGTDDDIDEDDIDVTDDADTDDEPYELPPIVMATEDDEDAQPLGDPLLARRLPGDGGADDRTDDRVDEDTDTPEVSDDILEELRRADIDGPTVAPQPQDDTSSGIRRPARAPDYDPGPFPIPVKVPRLLGRKPRVRRVTRVVRHVDPWSVFKIAIVANIVLYIILLTAGVLLWNVAYATGTVDNVERFFESFGWSEFEFNGGEIYHNAWIGGIFLVIGLTGLAVLMATLFNLITDLVGGIRLTVLEEEVVEARTSPMRRFVVRRAEPEVPVVMYDDSGPIIREAVVDEAGPA